jgi:hypothetical protein
MSKFVTSPIAVAKSRRWNCYPELEDLVAGQLDVQSRSGILRIFKARSSQVESPEACPGMDYP